MKKSQAIQLIQQEGEIIKYHAASKEELLKCKPNCFKLHFRLHIKSLFKHYGDFLIEENGLNFVGWRLVKWSEIKDVKLENDKIMSSKLFATQHRLFFLRSARPLKLILNNEILYFYVDWNFLTGLSRNKDIEKIMNRKMKI